MRPLFVVERNHLNIGKPAVTGYVKCDDENRRSLETTLMVMIDRDVLLCGKVHMKSSIVLKNERIMGN